MRKLVHKAKLVASNGDISPACSENPRKIDNWTLVDRFVTCPRCKAAMELANHKLKVICEQNTSV